MNDLQVAADAYSRVTPDPRHGFIIANHTCIPILDTLRWQLLLFYFQINPFEKEVIITFLCL